MGNTLYSNLGQSTTELDEIYCKYLNNLFNIYSYLFKYEHFHFMNSYTLNCFCHVLEGINNNEGHVLIKICKLQGETQKIKRILYTLKFLFSFDLFPNVLPYNRMSVYENNIYIYRRFILKSIDNYLSNEKNNKSFCYFFIFQIFLSIIQLHSLGVYHGHIKRENFLIQNNIHVLITDINILNNYLYFIPKIRYANERNGRLQHLREDIFNLGILILEILLNNKNISYVFLNESYEDNNDDNFYSGRRKQTKLSFMQNDLKKDQKCEKIINMSEKKTSENFVHALSLPFISKRIKNEEEDYFQKNKNVRMNIDKYKYYNYHYINSVNYINIYNDIYNNVTSYNLVNNKKEPFEQGNNENLFKSKTMLYDHNGEKKKKRKEFLHAHSDYEMPNDPKEIKGSISLNNITVHTQPDLYADDSYTFLNSLKTTGEYCGSEGGMEKKRKGKSGQKNGKEGNNSSGGGSESGSDNSSEKGRKSVPYKIWKVVNVVRNPFIIYSLINHFFLQKNNNIFGIFNYWSYHIFPSTYKYIFFPLTTLQLHPLFKNSDFFILLIHFNLPFILFHLDIFYEREKDKYALLKVISEGEKSGNTSKHYDYVHVSSPKMCTNKEKSSFKKLYYYKKIVNEFTTSVNKHQLKTYINDTKLSGKVKKKILHQWAAYKREKEVEQKANQETGKRICLLTSEKERKKIAYHSKCYFPFPVLSYKNTHEFYKNFMSFYKIVYCSIFYEEKSYMDIFTSLEVYKRGIYMPLFRDFYFKQNWKVAHKGSTSVESHNKTGSHKSEHVHFRWTFNEDIYQLVNMIICSYDSLLYESTKLLTLEILYCLIYHLDDTKLKKEVALFLLHCFNNDSEKIKIIVIKCVYTIFNNANTYEHMFLYIDKFLPTFYTLKDSTESFAKYFYAKYLPLFSNIAIQYIYNASVLEKRERSGKKTRGDTAISSGGSGSNGSSGSNDSSGRSGSSGSSDNRCSGSALSEVRSMEILKEVRDQLAFILKCTNYDILFELYENMIKFCKIMSKKWVKVYILPYLLANNYKPQKKFMRALCVKTTMRIVSYINEKETYRVFAEYVKALLRDNDELMLQFLLFESNIILKKFRKKHQKRNSKLFLFFLKKTKLNHLSNN
ncbi:serine/threonine protein kinase VPS15, putative (VPS15) [Plasmodium ovale wallikeri]|uniref:Serine/threonine protein kinase VPS15, putative (VPS15) n=1 Tax=Plasmodium ovale wallikeri TaxID=864142 RepID=A0A1A8YM53_PLAOA|nr:serine/threonine protein kinase VPS15, putative (VPS15) [Plasmodium ovale wallikeri]